MKKIKIQIITLVLAAAFASCQQGNYVNNSKVETREDSVAYSIGLSIAQQIKRDQLDTVLDITLIYKAIDDVVADNELAVPETEMNQIIQSYFAERQEEQRLSKIAETEKQYAENKEKGEQFLEENKGKEGVNVTESGLQYEVINMGSGEKPEASDRVKVHYHGTLIDGTVFDSSVERGEPTEFRLNQVIPGWTEGLQLMPEGSKFRFYIPQDLAYGMRETGEIKPFSTLVFEVELLDIIE